jgi:hypothetical protein
MSYGHPPAEARQLPPRQGRALVAGLLALATAAGVASATRWFIDPRRLAFSYLTAWVFVTSLSVGALAWLMLHHLTGAVWSVALRRLMENLTRPLPWLAILFIPLALNLELLYPWADSARLSADPGLAHKAAWLNPVLFTARSAIYLACWSVLAGILTRASVRQDQSGAPVLTRRMRATSAWGLVLLALTTSYAAFDWLMSLDAHWSSTIFGVYFWTGSLLSALAALTLMALSLQSVGWLRATVTMAHLHDLGKLLFGFVIFWAYIAFSQYFLIWYANFPEEIGWYITRRSGTWNRLSWLLLFGHFVVPLILLLFRATKRSPFWLAFVAAWILVFHDLDLYWLIMPAQRPEGAELHWLDATVLITLVCIWGAIVTRACLSRPLVPIGDPHLTESAAFHSS